MWSYMYIRDTPIPIIRPWYIRRHFYVYEKAIFGREALVLCSGKTGACIFILRLLQLRNGLFWLFPYVKIYNIHIIQQSVNKQFRTMGYWGILLLVHEGIQIDSMPVFKTT